MFQVLIGSLVTQPHYIAKKEMIEMFQVLIGSLVTNKKLSAVLIFAVSSPYR